MQECRTLVPRQVAAATDDHVALERGDRYEADVIDASALGEREEVVDNGCKDFFPVIDQIHFVNGDDEMRNAEQVSKCRMASRLRHDTVPRIDQQNGELRSTGGRHHIARVLLVAWRVGNDELAQSGREITVGNVDGNALFTLRGETVG